MRCGVGVDGRAKTLTHVFHYHYHRNSVLWCRVRVSDDDDDGGRSKTRSTYINTLFLWCAHNNRLHSLLVLTCCRRRRLCVSFVDRVNALRLRMHGFIAITIEMSECVCVFVCVS